MASIRRGFSSTTISHVYRLHHAPVVPITLKSLIDRGPEPPSIDVPRKQWEAENEEKIVLSAQYLHHEIPIRLAGRIVDLESLPSGLSNAPSVMQLRDMLLESFDEMVNYPVPIDRASERAFIEMQMKIRQKHVHMHGGIREALESFHDKYFDPKLASILDKFYHSRIGIRMIVDQHIATQQSKSGYIGIISNECNPTQITKEVVEGIQLQCDNAFGNKSPEFKVCGNANAIFKYIPGHLEVILSEVIKNAVKNTVSNGGQEPISIEVAGGQHGVSLKVSDSGGGMHWEDVPHAWSYKRRGKSSETTSYDPVASNIKRRVTDLRYDDPFGMPIARLYARYFDGELTIMPMEGSRTDVYLHLKRLSDDLEVK